MNPAQFDASTRAQDAEIQAQLCAYNAAFDELGLRFRWDAQTLASLATIEGELAQIAAYIAANHAHLLTAYSAEFLSCAILERKSARYPGALRLRAESLPPVNGVEHRAGASSQFERIAYDGELPALAGV